MYWYFIPFYGWITHSVATPHFVHSFVSRWSLRLLPNLAIMNDAINICAHVFMWTYFSLVLSTYLGVELLGPMVTLRLIAGGTGRLFSISHPHQHAVLEGSDLPTSSPTLTCFDSSCPSGCTMYSLWLWFAFPWRLMISSVFSCSYWPFVYLPREMSIRIIFAHFKNQIICLHYWVLRVLYIFLIQVPSRIHYL